MSPDTMPEGSGPEVEARALPAVALPAPVYPNLVALADPIMNQSMDDRFRFGLGVILDRLERRLDRSAP